MFFYISNICNQGAQSCWGARHGSPDTCHEIKINLAGGETYSQAQTCVMNVM